MSSLKSLFAVVIVGLFGVVAGCGGGGGGSSGTPVMPTLTSIAITPAPASVAAGATVQFVATGTYSDNSKVVVTSTVSWSSASTATATINASGLATGVAIGTSAITASLGTVTSPAVTLTVTAPLLKSIAITAVATSIAAGTTTQFSATGTYGDGSTAALTTGVTWISATPSVATINASGLATGVAAGTASVTAVVGTVTSAAVTLTVTPPALVSIAITPAAAPRILVKGGITQFTAIGSYANNTTATITTAVTWSSATAATATIGAATGLATVATPAPAVGATTVVTAAASGITSNAVTLVVSPAEFALVTNFTDATVSQYYVAGNGVLTPQTPATITTTPLTGTAAGTVWPFVVVVDPTASFAYVANYGANGENIAQYTIDKTTGLLTANGPNIATGTGPNGLAIFPSAANPSPSPYLYSVNINEHGAPYAHAISEFEYNTSGVLSNNPNAPFVAVTPPTGSAAGAPDPASIAIVNGSLGAYAYIADFTGPGRASYITEYSVSANGVLAPLTTPSIASGEQPNNIVVSPSGNYVYAVNNSDGSVSQYSIGAGGQLAPLSPATVTASPGSESIAFNPAGTYAYVANCPLQNGTPVASGSVSEFSVSPTTGALTLIGTESANLNLCPSFLTVDPSGQFLYVTNRGINQATAPPYGTTVSEFLIGDNGSLTPLSVGTVTTGNQPTGIVVFSE